MLVAVILYVIYQQSFVSKRIMVWFANCANSAGSVTVFITPATSGRVYLFALGEAGRGGGGKPVADMQSRLRQSDLEILSVTKLTKLH